MKANVLIDIVDAYRDHDGAPEFFKELVQILMDNGMTVNELEDCFGADDALDLVIENVLDEYDLSDDDDDWPDGGREDF